MGSHGGYGLGEAIAKGKKSSNTFPNANVNTNIISVPHI